MDYKDLLAHVDVISWVTGMLRFHVKKIRYFVKRSRGRYLIRWLGVTHEIHEYRFPLNNDDSKVIIITNIPSAKLPYNLNKSLTLIKKIFDFSRRR